MAQQQQQPQEYYAAQKDNLLWTFFFLSWTDNTAAPPLKKHASIFQGSHDRWAVALTGVQWGRAAPQKSSPVWHCLPKNPTKAT